MVVTHPSKEQVRQWMGQRQERREPPPKPDDIRRELGWRMIEAERKQVVR